MTGTPVTRRIGAWRRRLALALGLLASLPAARADTLAEIREAGVIRVCADPHNLPFSDKDLAPAGYELEIAGKIAEELGVRLDYLWFHTGYGKRALRQLQEGRCDFFMGLPTVMAGSLPRLALSRPYYVTGFVPVVRPGPGYRQLSKFKDGKVGVEMMTVADFQLFRQGYSRDLYRNQAAIFHALAARQIDAALMWYPTAAWLIKSTPEAGLAVLAQDGDPSLRYEIAVALRREDESLRLSIDTILSRLEAEGGIQQILQRYGLSVGPEQTNKQP